MSDVNEPGLAELRDDNRYLRTDVIPHLLSLIRIADDMCAEEAAKDEPVAVDSAAHRYTYARCRMGDEYPHFLPPARTTLRTRSNQQGIAVDSCCDNEKRSMAGGCINCGDPCF